MTLTALLLFLSAVCACYAFDLTGTELRINYAQSTDEASQIFWHWLLKHVRLSSKNAALHNVFEDGSAAVFFDLNDDGIDEIVGTHFASAAAGNGDCMLYILQKDKDKYKKISSGIYFDPSVNIYAQRKKTDGYRNLQVFPVTGGKPVIYSFNKKSGLYEKSK